MKVVKRCVRAEAAGRVQEMWAILCGTRENRLQRIVIEPPTHLSLNKPIGEQNSAEENATDTLLRLAEGLTRHCLASSIQPDPLCRT
jgi:hypothetical protein